tara:strand:+ start:817 stop:1020 length:204 start_codon:yes stop_codon:yes gene_type:complete
MPNNKTLQIFQSFQKLKKQKNKMPKNQYVKELLFLKNALDEHIKNPRNSDAELTEIYRILGGVKPST